jgi:hypothetical protein
LTINGFEARPDARPRIDPQNTGWVKMTGRIVIFVLLLFGSLHLIGRSLIDHASVGHGNHALSSATEHGRQQP